MLSCQKFNIKSTLHSTWHQLQGNPLQHGVSRCEDIFEDSQCFLYAWPVCLAVWSGCGEISKQNDNPARESRGLRNITVPQHYILCCQHLGDLPWHSRTHQNWGQNHLWGIENVCLEISLEYEEDVQLCVPSDCEGEFLFLQYFGRPCFWKAMYLSFHLPECW